jgi:hypothetical protein
LAWFRAAASRTPRLPRSSLTAACQSAGLFSRWKTEASSVRELTRLPSSQPASSATFLALKDSVAIRIRSQGPCRSRMTARTAVRSYRPVHQQVQRLAGCGQGRQGLGQAADLSGAACQPLDRQRLAGVVGAADEGRPAEGVVPAHQEPPPFLPPFLPRPFFDLPERRARFAPKLNDVSDRFFATDVSCNLAAEHGVDVTVLIKVN